VAVRWSGERGGREVTGGKGALQSTTKQNRLLATTRTSASRKVAGEEGRTTAVGSTRTRAAAQGHRKRWRRVGPQQKVARSMWTAVEEGQTVAEGSAG
jgi:hypothetical protein